jgi:hypothetical protein
MDLDPRFDFVHTTLYRCNQAISELLYILEEKSSKDEARFASTHIFPLYAISLHYLFNAEYNKLLEEKTSKEYPDNHIASIPKLNRFLLEQEGEKYYGVYAEIETMLKEVISNGFSIRQRLLRNKRFSHADLHEVNNPFRFPAMTLEEISEGLASVKDLFSCFNKATNYFDITIVDLVPSIDDRTRNFIRSHTVYERFYFDNLAKAWEAGYRT